MLVSLVFVYSVSNKLVAVWVAVLSNQAGSRTKYLQCSEKYPSLGLLQYAGHPCFGSVHFGFSTW